MLSPEALANALWLIPLGPLLASLFIAAFGKNILKEQSHWPCVLSLGLSCLVSFAVLLSGPGHVTASIYEWIHVGGVNIDIKLQVDALTAIMLVTVTFVSTLVAVYSIGYMHGDPGYPRFFAEISLFVFSMTMLVLAANFLLLYVFWEAVGLCSYLLIGYWYERPSAAAAARKAFLVNRIGDAGFALGIFFIWVNFGFVLDYDAVFAQAASVDHETLVLICLLLFTGAVGKSAQFPLHVWLPDAMEGPSPVSALIHAATMVTAGVYMVARCTPLFFHAPEAQLIVAGVGGFTALLAALIALTQNDLKRVLAYSTVSQLGYMFLALGSCAYDKTITTFAVTAAIFHLFTHAFFKALLFLGAGSVMHSMGDVIDMRRFGGLRRVLKHTHWTFLIGCLALAGIPPLAGFWSKDEILNAVYHAIHGGGSEYHVYFMVLFILGLVTAFLTAFYTFRAYFMTFWGEEFHPPEAGHHPHESPSVILGPLVILAAGALGVGVAFGPMTHWFADYLAETPGFEHSETHPFNWTVVIGSTLFAVAGVGLAWGIYSRRKAPVESRFAANQPWWYRLSLNKFYFDEIYNAIIVLPARALAALCRVWDQYIVDGLVDLVGWLPALAGKLFQPLQNGLVQFYALAMVLGLTVFVVALVRTLAG